MLIRALGENSHAIGQSFERLIDVVLYKSGYRNIQTDIHTTGTEIDLTANNLLTKNPLICQCKAKRDKTHSAELRLFYGDYKKEKARNNDLVGLFLFKSDLIQQQCVGTTNWWKGTRKTLSS
jgi:Holliday junction resolvase-like predicted endonuclease